MKKLYKKTVSLLILFFLVSAGPIIAVGAALPKECTFYVHLTDGDGLSGYIFGWKNGTEVWQNDTWISFSGNPTETCAESTKILPNEEKYHGFLSFLF